MHPDRLRWNEKYLAKGRAMPSIALLRYQARLRKGRALDLAGGRGENAAILALAGWTVTLLDLSDLAIERARARATELRTRVHLIQADALRLPLRGPFDTIIVTGFLERRIASELSALLASGGTLFCEQPTRGLPEAYRVRPGEFARLFDSLEALVDVLEGDRAVFIGRRKD